MTLKDVMLGFGAMLLTMGVLVGLSGGFKTEAPQKQGAESSPAPAAAWVYADYVDHMRGEVTRSATIESAETFPGPISSAERATELEVSQRRGREYVTITNPNLQFTCSGFVDTSVAVKFDRGKVQSFPCTDEASHQYGVAFIEDAPAFTRQLRRARRVVIEAEVFQRGRMQMTFDNPGLDWARLGKP